VRIVQLICLLYVLHCLSMQTNITVATYITSDTLQTVCTGQYVSNRCAFRSFVVVALSHKKYHPECITTNHFKVKIQKKIMGRGRILLPRWVNRV